MSKPINVLYSITVVVLFLINPGLCGKAMKGCRCSDDVARSMDDLGKHVDDGGRNGKQGENITPAVEKIADDTKLVNQATEESAQSKKVHQKEDGSYTYGNNDYNRFDDILFSAGDNVFIERSLTSQEASYLMQRGVKFVFSNPAFERQRSKPFKIIYLISEDVETVKSLYELDADHASKLIDYSSNIDKDEKIIKANSYNEMLAKESIVRANNEVPILIFHNNLQKPLTELHSEVNFITCNSFMLNPESYLTSTDFLDMRAIIEAVNKSYSGETLAEFYNNFTNAYYAHMLKKHKLTTLVYIGGGVGMAGGISAIAYYNYNSN